MYPAGWYDDPAGRHPQRYWDGERWTEYVAGPTGQGIDPLPGPPARPQQSAGAGQPAQTLGQLAQQQGSLHSSSPATGDSFVQSDPAQLHAVLAELGIRPMPAGDGTVHGEPLLVLAFSADRPDGLEWWTPAGRLIAAATIVEKQKPGKLQAPSTDPGSGAMIGSQIVVVAADGTPIATTVRTLKPAKPPTYVDDPSGQRIVAVAQEKMFSKIATYSVLAPTGESVGRFVAADRRGSSLLLSGSAGEPLVTVVKNGKWDAGNVILEFSRNRPFQTPGEWLATRLASRVMPIKRERICSVVVRERPPSDARQALLSFLAPLLLEHTMSLL